MAEPIKYTSEVPAFFTEAYLINSFCGIESFATDATINSIIYRKSAEWEYEQEWRVSGGFGRNKEEAYEDVNFGWNELDGIIFGLSTTEADKAEIRKLCEAYPNIVFMQTIKIAGSSTLYVNVID
ncbi:hypothetical protein [Rhizobium sullae]|uniref:hypothetical protein n=1 Tax=Rhizobium sullae TaxID=50338 RepID=UPI000B34CBD6|nr:hypothetical protein [Rhizobium sullae]